MLLGYLGNAPLALATCVDVAVDLNLLSGVKIKNTDRIFSYDFLAGCSTTNTGILSVKVDGG